MSLSFWCFTLNTTMVILPGDHAVDKDITVSNIARLTMHVESSSCNPPTIICSGLVILGFTGMLNFNICYILLWL